MIHPHPEEIAQQQGGREDGREDVRFRGTDHQRCQSRGNESGRHAGNKNTQDQINDLATLLVVQQLFDDSNRQDNNDDCITQDDEKIVKIDMIKNEILDLLLEE